MDMAITTDLFEAFLKCRTKCFLRARAEIETGNVYADWFRTESDRFHSEGIKRLVAGVAPDKLAAATAATENVGLAQWQWAINLEARSEDLRCSCHALERIPSVVRGRTVQLVPVRFAFTNRLTRHDRL